LWFQAVSDIQDKGRRFKIDKGSYAGQTRLEFDYFVGHVSDPGYGSGTQEILPQIPEGIRLPNPVELGYVYGGEGFDRSYVEYIMTPTKQPGESYTYGERLTKASLNNRVMDWRTKGISDIVENREVDGKIIFEEDGRLYINQIEAIIDTYRKYGHRNNQMVLQVAQPSDLELKDPPCLRSIDTRIQDERLHFDVHFRSWDLWGGFPANLAGIQTLKEYMASEIGVGDGEMIVNTKGLHLYGYAEDLASMRCLR
jgi:thymidylate synthase